MEGMPVFCLIFLKNVYRKARTRVLIAYHEVQGDGLLGVEAEPHASRQEDPLGPALHGGGAHERAHLVQLINLRIIRCLAYCALKITLAQSHPDCRA
jgi:hypothetical protein